MYYVSGIYWSEWGKDGTKNDFFLCFVVVCLLNVSLTLNALTCHNFFYELSPRFSMRIDFSIHRTLIIKCECHGVTARFRSHLLILTDNAFGIEGKPKEGCDRLNVRRRKEQF